MNVRQLESGHFPVDSWHQSAAGCVCFKAGGHEVEISRYNIKDGIVIIIPSRFSPYLDCSSQGVLIGTDKETVVAIKKALAWPPRRKFKKLETGDHAITGWEQIQPGYIIIHTEDGPAEVFDVDVSNEKIRLVPSQFEPKISVCSFERTIWHEQAQIDLMFQALGL